MVFYCCVPLCNNRTGGHKFPKDSKLRLQWRLAVRRKCGGTIDKLWQPTSSSRVCSDHFRPEDYKPNCIRKVLLPEAIPSIFSFRHQKGRKTHNSAANNTSQPYSPLVTETMPDAEVADVALQIELGEEYSSEEASDMQENSYVGENQQEPARINQEIAGMASQTTTSHFYLDFKKAIRDSEFVAHFTGFRSYEHFMMLFNLLCPAALNLDYKSELGPKAELFVVLTKLRRAKDDMELAYFFTVHQTTISKIVTTWINFMYMQFKEIDTWAPAETIQQFSPSDFHQKFPRTRVILDATEIPIEKPEDVLLQSTSFSRYKNKNTMKCIVGISPRGAVTFISDCYGGSTSDRQIVERSNLLTMFDKGDGILVDRGLTVQDLFATSDVKVDIPTFLRGRYQLDIQEVAHDRKIASKRIHVERVIGLAKKFKILDRSLSHSKRALAGRIIYVCFSLLNFFPTIVDEFA